MNRGAVWSSVQVLRQIGVHHFSSPVIQSFVDNTNRIVRAPTRPVSIRRLVEVRFEDRFDHQLGCGLHHPIPDGGYPERPLAHAAGLRDHHPSHWLRGVASCPNVLPQLAKPAEDVKSNETVGIGNL